MWGNQWKPNLPLKIIFVAKQLYYFILLNLLNNFTTQWSYMLLTEWLVSVVCFHIFTHSLLKQELCWLLNLENPSLVSSKGRSKQFPHSAMPYFLLFLFVSLQLRVIYVYCYECRTSHLIRVLQGNFRWN